MLAALAPAALEISLQVGEDLEAERSRHHSEWQQRLERARYEAERSERQYQAVEPENRLVARTLEQHWEAALAAEEQLKADYARFLNTRPQALSAAERARIRQLAADIPALWQAATTTPAERQAIVRQLIERVIVTVIDDSERVAVEVHWVGGHRTRTAISPPGGPPGAAELLPRAGGACPVLTSGRAALSRRSPQQLNAEGWRPAKRRETFNGPMVAGAAGPPGAARGPRATARGGRRRARRVAIDRVGAEARHAHGHLIQLAAEGVGTGPPGRTGWTSPMAGVGRRRRDRAPPGTPASPPALGQDAAQCGR